MKAIMTVFALILAISAISFAAEKKSPAASDTVQIVTVDSVEYYVAAVTAQLRDNSLAIMMAEQLAERKMEKYLTARDSSTAPYYLLLCKNHHSRPERQINGTFRVTATVRVPVVLDEKSLKEIEALTGAVTEALRLKLVVIKK